MKLIKPSVEILEQKPGLQGIYDMIELCGKTSYKSPVKGGEDAKRFVDARIQEKHYAVLEFGTVYLKIPVNIWDIDRHEWEYMFPDSLPWVSLNCDGEFVYVTTNFRHIIEGKVGLDTVSKFLCNPTNAHAKRYCARFITDRGVSHELVRHRKMSFCQESTRYCNYSRDKFGNELTCIIPDKEAWKGNDAYYEMINCLDEIEHVYMKALVEGVTPQIARGILPNILKTEICMCGFEDDWRHFFDLRYRGTTGKPHPDMLNVATMLYNEFTKRGISL